MENFEELVISLLDSNAMKGKFIKELCRILNLPVVCVSDVWLETELIEGVATQYVKVAFIDAEITKERLMELPFHSIYENVIIFEVGDTVL